MRKKNSLPAMMLATMMMLSACGSAAPTSSASSDETDPQVSISDSTGDDSADSSPHAGEKEEEERTPESFGSLSTYQIEFNGNVVKFPIKYSEFLSLTGLALEEGHPTEIEADSDEAIGVKNGEFDGYISLKNYTDQTASYQDCYVISLMVTMSRYFSDEGFSVVFPDGIKLWESTREEVYAAYGKPTREWTGTLEDQIEYTIENGWRGDVDVFCSFEFEFDDDDVLTDFSFDVDIPPVV